MAGRRAEKQSLLSKGETGRDVKQNNFLRSKMYDTIVALLG